MTSFDDTNDTGAGNTKCRSRTWVYTLNHPETKELEILTKIDTETQRYARQEEIGENGNYHIQGCWMFKNARRFTALKKQLPRIHLEKMKGSWKQASDYCLDPKKRMKDGQYWTSEKTLKNPMENVEWKDWQIKIIDLIEGIPDNRSIVWLWDEKGNTGKTTLAKYICMNYDGAYYLQGKANDIKFGVSQMEDPKILIFDFTRSVEDYISYEAIEAVKNGIFFAGKYESAMKIYDPPHVICFANFVPEKERLSEDRWIIDEIY